MADLSGSATVHTITDSERKAYVEYINSCLKNDPVMKGVIPIDPDSKTAIYAAIKQSVLLGYVTCYLYYLALVIMMANNLRTKQDGCFALSQLNCIIFFLFLLEIISKIYVQYSL
jgi:hypothetical protein